MGKLKIQNAQRCGGELVSRDCRVCFHVTLPDGTGFNDWPSRSSKRSNTKYVLGRFRRAPARIDR